MRFTDIATWRPLENGRQARMARHDIICLHTMVGYLKSTDAMFRRGGNEGVESHFGVGGIWGSDREDDLDGVIYQWMDTEDKADANLEGNHRLISIETADNAPRSASDIKPWTPKQCAAIIRLVARLCKRYDIPAVLVPDSRPNRRGIAYHRQGINPWRVSGGELWSGARGKECPGDERIRQIEQIIIPGVRAELAGRPVTPQEEDDVSFKDEHKLTAADVKAYGDKGLKVGDEKSYDEIVRFPPAVARLRREMAAQFGALQGTISALTGAIKDGGTLTEAQITAAAEAGARAALSELGDALTD